MIKKFKKRIFFLFLAMTLIFSFSQISYADRICVHGHSIAVENPDYTEVKKKGDGAYISPYPHTVVNTNNNWVHYSIPVESEKYYSKIRIKYHIGNCEDIERVDVYDGLYRFLSVVDPEHTSGDYMVVPFKESRRIWNSIGVSIRLSRTWDACSYQPVKIISVCAFE